MFSHRLCGSRFKSLVCVLVFRKIFVMRFFSLRKFLPAIFAIAFCAIAFADTNSAPQLTEQQRLNIALEALSRLQASDLEKNPQFKAAAYRILAKTRGTPDFVRVVKQLELKDQNEGLLQVAVNQPSEESGVEAARLILANDGLALLKTSLEGSNAVRTAEALGNSGKKEAVPLLLSVVKDAARDLALRKQAVRSAAQTEEGARELLKLAKDEKLAQDLKLTASAELHNVRWEKINSEAAKILPLPQSHDSKPLPNVAELLKMKGEAANGEKVFFRAESACSTCHQIKGKGTEVGPALSEIGTKLGKEAIVESILEPSAGISVGYEASQVELKSGDEAYGLVISETDEEIALKDLKGIVAHYKRSDIARQDKLTTSIMPAGLQQTMSAQELVDLVEFLSALRKAN
jgi:putative heme-binding domain-containing protein